MKKKYTLMTLIVIVIGAVLVACGKNSETNSSKVDEIHNERINKFTTENSDIKFEFDYPDNWKVIKNESYEVYEEVILQNDRGVTITYWKYNIFPLGGYGHAYMSSAEAEKVSNSLLDNYIVCKIQMVESVDMMTGEEESIENGDIYYALLEKNREGLHGGMVGLTGFYEEFSFLYNSSNYRFVAEAPDGKYTQEEEKEIIEIISSFRLAEESMQTQATENFSEYVDETNNKTIDELWKKLNGTWDCEAYTYMGRTDNEFDRVLEFEYIDEKPCIRATNKRNDGTYYDTFVYDVSTVDEYIYEVYVYKKDSYNGDERANWSDDILLVWYSFDLENISQGELLINYNMSYNNGFVDNHIFKYHIED